MKKAPVPGMALPRLAGRIFGEPLAIDQAKLDVIVSAIGPRLRGMSMDDFEEEDDPDAAYQVDASGIAHISVDGTLVAKCSGMAAMSGLVSYADVAANYTAAMQDSSVRGLAVHYDTPGGEVAGMFECADLMYSLRGTKPVCAVVSCAASAGYALASTADRIVVARTGIAGSIGIIALHLDQSRADAQEGLKYTAVYAGARKNDGNPHEPLTPEAKGSIQSRVDAVYAMFTDSVARNRGMAGEDIIGTQAAIYMGQDAVSVGLADDIGTADDAVTALSTAIQRGSNSLSASDFSSSAAPAASFPKEGNHMAEQQAAPAGASPTAAEIEAMVAAARAEGFTVSAEISDLCALAGMSARAPGFIAARTPVQDVRAALMAAQVEAQRGTDLNTTIMPGADATGAKTEGKAKPWTEVLKALGCLKGGK